MPTTVSPMRGPITYQDPRASISILLDSFRMECYSIEYLNVKRAHVPRRQTTHLRAVRPDRQGARVPQSAGAARSVGTGRAVGGDAGSRLRAVDGQRVAAPPGVVRRAAGRVP